VASGGPPELKLPGSPRAFPRMSTRQAIIHADLDGPLTAPCYKRLEWEATEGPGKESRHGVVGSS
jgi:hypothetical protein